jgi:hypothetical protein
MKAGRKKAWLIWVMAALAGVAAPGCKPEIDYLSEGEALCREARWEEALPLQR